MLLGSMLFLLLTLCLTTCTAVAHAQPHSLWMPHFFSNNMVLQREPQRATLWGSAPPNTAVKITLDNDDGQFYGTFADATGQWTIQLPPQPVSINRTILVTNGANSTSTFFTNVAFGDVYICSGQSNMEMVLNDVFNGTEEIAASINYPNLRLYTIARLTSPTPVNDTSSRFPDTSGWMVSSPSALNGTTWTYFSAMCYLFGSNLYRNLDGAIPIGLIETCWGGTRIEAWTSPSGLAQCGPVVPEVDSEGEERELWAVSKAPSTVSKLSLDRAFAPEKLGDPDPQAASVLWNGMVAPLLQLQVTGVVWYQASANAANATNYACRFPAMIEDWRLHFNNYKLHFFFVVLAAYKEGGNPTWSLIIQAQLQALQLPYVGVASAQDLGDEYGSLGPIHSRNKTLIGVRLSLLAQSLIYGQDVVADGPAYADIVWPPREYAPIQTVILRFRSEDPSAQQLHLLGTSGCTACCNLTGSPIALVLSDNTTQQAVVQVLPELYMVTATVKVGAPDVFVTGVQLNWVDYPECALYNGNVLPHLPFLASEEM